jgi:hypothetical protein
VTAVDSSPDAVALARENSEQVERIGQHEADHGRGRQQQDVRSGRLPDSAPAEAPSPRGGNEPALGDGRHSSSFGREATHAPVFRILVI